MRDPFAVNIIDDLDLQAEVMRASHAVATAMANHEPDHVVNTLVTEVVSMHPAAIVVCLGHAHVALRMALDLGDHMHPGFRDHFLRSLGASLLEEP